MEASSSDLNTISEKMEVTSPIVAKPKRVSRFKVTATATPMSPPSQEAEYSQSTANNNDEKERKEMNLGKDSQQEGPADTKIRVVEKSSGAQMPDASLGAPTESSIPENKAERGKHLLPSRETMEARETSVLHVSEAETYLSQGSGEVKEPVNRSKTLGGGLVDGGGSHLQSTRRRSVGVVPRVSVQINGTDNSAALASESSPEGVVLARRHSVSTGEVVGRGRYTENPAMHVDSATHTTKQESYVSEGSSPGLQKLTAIQVPGNTLQSMSEYNAPNGAPVMQDTQAPVDAHLVLLRDGHEGCLPQTQLVRQLTERLNNLQGIQGLTVHDNGREQTLNEVPNAVDCTHAHIQTGATTEQGVLLIDRNIQHRDAIRDRELGMLRADRSSSYSRSPLSRRLDSSDKEAYQKRAGSSRRRDRDVSGDRNYADRISASPLRQSSDRDDRDDRRHSRRGRRDDSRGRSDRYVSSERRPSGGRNGRSRDSTSRERVRGRGRRSADRNRERSRDRRNRSSERHTIGRRRDRTRSRTGSRSRSRSRSKSRDRTHKSSGRDRGEDYKSSRRAARSNSDSRRSKGRATVEKRDSDRRSRDVSKDRREESASESADDEGARSQDADRTSESERIEGNQGTERARSTSSDRYWRRGKYSRGKRQNSRSLSPFSPRGLSPYRVSSEESASASESSDSSSEDERRRRRRKKTIKKQKKKTKKSKSKKDKGLSRPHKHLDKKKETGARSMITGELIKMKVKKTSKEKADEKNRSELLTFLNEAT